MTEISKSVNRLRKKLHRSKQGEAFILQNASKKTVVIRVGKRGPVCARLKPAYSVLFTPPHGVTFFANALPSGPAQINCITVPA